METHLITNRADQQLAASLLQAIVIVIPVWIGVSQILLRGFISSDGSEEAGSRRDRFVSYTASSYTMLGVAIGGIVFELRPISIGFVVTFASFLGLLAAAAVLLVDIASTDTEESQEYYSNHPFTEGTVRGALAVIASGIFVWLFSAGPSVIGV